MNLTDKQEYATKYLKDTTTVELLYGGGAGGGKTALGCLWLMDCCTQYPATRWLMGRSKLKTLKETTLNTFFELSTKLGLHTQYNYNSQSGTILFNNGAEILLKDLYQYPSDPNFDSLGSLEITGAFIDEANQITNKAKNIVKSRIRYKLDEYNLTPKLLLTCNPSKNWTYSEFYKPHQKGELPIYRKFLQSLLSDNQHISKFYEENLRTLDDNSKQRLLYGNWDYDNDPTSLVDYEQITNLYTNIFVQGGNKYIIADIARFGSDKAIITVWDGLKLIDRVSFATSAMTEIQNSITALRIKYGVQLSKVLVDEDGIGGGVKDNLHCRGFLNGGKPKNKNYQNNKTECAYKLAEMIGEIHIEVELQQSEKEALEQELSMLKTYEADKDGKLRVLPKEKIKDQIGRSPDWLDCFIMRMYYEVRQTNYIIQ
jgi:hypothetical protein